MEYFQNLDFSQTIDLIFLGVGLAILIISIFTLVNSLRAKKWTMTMGKIIHSEVCTSLDVGDSIATYRPKIVFEYSVFGEKFTCDRVYFGVKIMSSSNLPNSRKLVAKYPVNKEVPVYYNPHRPKQAVIEPWLHFGRDGLLFVLLSLVMSGVFFYHNNDFVHGFIDQVWKSFNH